MFNTVPFNPTNGYLTRVPSADLSTPNYAVDPDVNLIDSATARSLIISAPSESFKNYIGYSSVVPVGTDFSNSSSWTVDSGYVAGSANVVSIIGGYDNVVNQIAGDCLGANHSYIQYNVNGHSTIVGGSYNWISGHRSTIIGGTNCKIVGATTHHGALLAGEGNAITASSFNTILNGASNSISGSGQYNFIGSGLSNILSGTSTNNSICSGNSNVLSATYDFIANGSSNTLSGNYNAVFSGNSNTISGTNCVAMAGDSNTVSHNGAIAIGRDIKSIVTGGIHYSSGKLVNTGDAQAGIVHFKIRTTNATATNMTSVATFIELDDATTTALILTVKLVGVVEATGAASAYQWEGLCTWNGTTLVIADTGGTSGSSRPMNVVVNNALIVTPPTIEGNTGSIRPKVTGLAATNIKWSATMMFSMLVI